MAGEQPPPERPVLCAGGGPAEPAAEALPVQSRRKRQVRGSENQYSEGEVVPRGLRSATKWNNEK